MDKRTKLGHVANLRRFSDSDLAVLLDDLSTLTGYVESRIDKGDMTAPDTVMVRAALRRIER